MALNIDATWSKPIELLDASNAQESYRVANLESIPEEAGAYIFARRHGASVEPIYIGETLDLRKRLEEHLLKNVRLMKGLEGAQAGKRLYLYCTVKPKRGQDIRKVLKVLQRALVEHALSAGHKLMNIQLTKTPLHTITFKGNRTSEKIAPRKMFQQSQP